MSKYFFLNFKTQSLNRDEFKIHKEFMKSELEKEDMRLKIANLNHDITCLLTAFNSAKKTGKFELRNIMLKEISPEKFNTCFSMIDDGGKRVHFSESNTNNNNNNNSFNSISLDYLKAELNHREDIINTLEQELKSLRSQYDSLISGVRV